VAFEEGDRVEVTRDQKGHGILIKAGRQGTYVNTHPHLIGGTQISHVKLDDDGGATRIINTEDLKQA
jgi:hypothetical protein